jgi:hypothetical protein
MKPLIYHRNQWLPVWEQIKRDYPASVYLIRTNMRQTLGFSVRDHLHFDNQSRSYRPEVHLDFYGEKYLSHFLLKYGNIK